MTASSFSCLKYGKRYSRDIVKSQLLPVQVSAENGGSYGRRSKKKRKTSDKKADEAKSGSEV